MFGGKAGSGIGIELSQPGPVPDNPQRITTATDVRGRLRVSGGSARKDIARSPHPIEFRQGVCIAGAYDDNRIEAWPDAKPRLRRPRPPCHRAIAHADGLGGPRLQFDPRPVFSGSPGLSLDQRRVAARPGVR